MSLLWWNKNAQNCGWVFLYTDDGTLFPMLLPFYAHTNNCLKSFLWENKQDFSGIVGSVIIKKCYFHSLETQLKPRGLAGGLLVGCVADRHLAIYDHQAQRPKQAVWLSAEANSCWQLNQWKLAWCNSNLLSRWSPCQLQVRSQIQSLHHHHHHHVSMFQLIFQSTCPRLSGMLKNIYRWHITMIFQGKGFLLCTLNRFITGHVREKQKKNKTKPDSITKEAEKGWEIQINDNKLCCLSE